VHCDTVVGFSSFPMEQSRTEQNRGHTLIKQCTSLCSETSQLTKSVSVQYAHELTQNGIYHAMQ
jgi:hypothetical protein